MSKGAFLAIWGLILVHFGHLGTVFLTIWGPMLGYLGHLGPMLALLGSTWAPMWPSRAHFVRLWIHFGAILGAIWEPFLHRF